MSELPEGWAEATIDELGEIVGGGTPTKSRADFWEGSIPWVSPKDMKRPIIHDTQDRITESAVECSAAKIVPTGSVLVVTRSGILAHSFPVAIAATKVTLNQDLKAIVPNGAVNSEFLAWAFRCFQRDILNRCSKDGTTVHSIELGEFKAFPIPLPPLNEQRRIVAKIEALFSRLEEGVAALRGAKARLKLYRQSLLKAAFEGRLTETWRRQNPHLIEPPETLLSRIPAPKQPKGGRKPSEEVIEGIAALAVNKPRKPAPEGWAWIPLLRIARQETGHTPSRKHPEYWNGGRKWIGIPDARAHHGKVIFATAQNVSDLGLANSASRILPEGTVCLSRTASVGYVCIMGEPMATSQDFATWTCTEALNPFFLMYAIMAEGDEIRRFGKGTTHTTIYFPEIRALHICLPPPAEQAEIVRILEERLSRADALEAEIDTALARAEALRQAILKRAFSGRLVPQDPTDEPATTLLTRLRAQRAAAPKPKRASRRTKSRSETNA